MSRSIPGAGWLCAAWLLCVHPLSAQATDESPVAVTADGGRYYGPLVDGKRQGQGRVEWDNGSYYEGDFDNGLFSGHGRLRSAEGDLYDGDFRAGMFEGHGTAVTPNAQYEGQFRLGAFWGDGEMRYRDGRRYRGAFAHGQFEGQGRFEDASSGIYEGSFEHSEFTGFGVFTRPNGLRHEGQFRDWKPEGAGIFSDGHGTTYEGEFLDGQLVGIARITDGNGSRYEGAVKGWLPDGQGQMRLASGDVYQGQFRYGQYDGEGTLTYAKPQGDGRMQDSGTWRFGRLKKADDEERQRARANAETALYSQAALLAKALGALAPRDPGAINLYLLAIAGDGSQEVFRREVDFVRTQFDADFGTRGHSLQLVNSRNTAGNAPMATVTSIRRSVAAIAAAMDKERDILFLYITSHGSADHEISLGLSGMDLPGLSASELGTALKESGIRWKVVVISACYAGGFIDAVRDPDTLVLTAARHDRRSFGCADENDFTYFGRAYFKEALPNSTSFQDAFSRAQKLIGEWEDKDARDGAAADAGAAQPESERHSFPQMDNPPAISDYLQRWWAQRAASPRDAAAAIPIRD